MIQTNRITFFPSFHSNRISYRWDPRFIGISPCWKWHAQGILPGASCSNVAAR